MQTQLVRKAAQVALGEAVQTQLARRKIVDIRAGIALFRSRDVPFRYKLLCVAIGVALTALVEFLELPVETILAALLGPLGLGIDVAIDGAEAVALPLLFAAALLPHIAPKSVNARG